MKPLNANPNVKSTHVTVDVDRKPDIIGNKYLHTVLVVETDLVLDAMAADYDEAAVNRLLSDIEALQAVNTAIDRVQINPRR